MTMKSDETSAKRLVVGFDWCGITGRATLPALEEGGVYCLSCKLARTWSATLLYISILLFAHLSLNFSTHTAMAGECYWT